MSVSEWVRGRGGVVRSRVLARAGWTERAARSEVDAGMLLRPRKGWVATPDAEPVLLACARSGVVLSCVSMAARLGLWMLRVPERPHVVAPPSSGAVQVAGPGAPHVHWAKAVVPRHPDALTDTVENVLALVAGCLPHDEALAVWESALDKRLVTLPELRQLPFRGRAAAVLAECSPYSGSGLETFVPPRLRWLKLPIVPQVWLLGHRVDFLIGDRLVFQVDGGTHVGAQRERDIAHDAALMLLGYHVIRVGYAQVIERWQEVQDLIVRAVAQGLHLAR